MELAKLLDRVPIPVKEGLDEPAAKINVLLQVGSGVWGLPAEGGMQCALPCSCSSFQPRYDTPHTPKPQSPHSPPPTHPPPPTFCCRPTSAS